MRFFKKISLILCGVDLVFAIDSFMYEDWIFGTLGALSTLAFLILGWKENKKND